MQWYIWGIYHVAQQGSTQIICCISKSVVLLSALCRTKITSGRIVSFFIPGSKIKLTACITKFKISRSEYIENGLCSSFAESDISNIFKTLGHKSSQASNQKNMEERNLGSMQIIFFAKVSRVWQNSHFQKQIRQSPRFSSRMVIGIFCCDTLYLSNSTNIHKHWDGNAI